MQREIIARVDHKLLNDVLPFRTTAENMASYFYEVLTKHLAPLGVEVLKLKLWETLVYLRIMYAIRSYYADTLHCADEISKLPEVVCRGGSCIIDPYGHFVTQPVWDKEEIIFADLDMEMMPASRMEFDVCGHYARPDVLDLKVRE